jgi:hypothetical protein
VIRLLFSALSTAAWIVATAIWFLCAIRHEWAEACFFLLLAQAARRE